MIKELTEAQKARFPEFVKKWTDIGLCTKPANRKLAEEGVIDAYRIAGLEAPKIVWCDSPLSMGITRAIIQELEINKTQDAWDSVWESVRRSAGDSVGESVRRSVWKSVWESVEDSVGDSVWYSVRRSVWQSVWQSASDSVREFVREFVSESVRESGYGQHDAEWLGFYDFFSEVCGLETQTEKIDGLKKIAQNAGWFLPCREICWISERHSVINQDDEDNIHCEDGPAILYPDGWGIYAIHGVRVPEYVIMQPEKITIEDIDSEENIEIKRIKIEKYGQEKYLLDSNAELIAEDDWGKLYRKAIGDDEDLVMVHVVNSTVEADGSYNDYFLRVHPELRPMLDNNEYGKPQDMSALNAVASTFGLTGKEYAECLIMQT